MRVLMVHCRYQIRGGEDECFEAEQRLLREAGVEVDGYEDDNRRVEQLRRPARRLDTVWSRSAYRAIRERLREQHYDVVHVHNFFPLISPAVYHAAQAEGCAVVQTLHNYRLLCPAGIFYRDGQVCEDCLGRRSPGPASPMPATAAAAPAPRRSRRCWPAIACSAPGAQGRPLHRAQRVHAPEGDRGGLPARQDRDQAELRQPRPRRRRRPGGFALFVARLNPEKGVPSCSRPGSAWAPASRSRSWATAR